MNFGRTLQRLFQLLKTEIVAARDFKNGGLAATAQFGGIGNVIQSGGDEGMWTFDRYQRWVEHQRDWVRPVAPVVTASDRDVPIKPAVARVSSPPGAAAPVRKPAAPKQGSPEEINIDEDLNLDEINELARSIERRTPVRELN